MNTYKKEGTIKGELVVDGDLILTGNLIVEKGIDVKGNIDCAGYSIQAGGFIQAGRFIQAGAFTQALQAQRDAGAEEERERIKKEICSLTLLNDGNDVFVKLGEALWVCDTKEDRDKFTQALTPPTK